MSKSRRKSINPLDRARSNRNPDRVRANEIDPVAYMAHDANWMLDDEIEADARDRYPDAPTFDYYEG